MFVVRSKRGKPVARFATKREAEVFIRIRSARRPNASRSPDPWDERNGMVIELSEWADYPIDNAPGYLAPIARDAGVDLRKILSLQGSVRQLNKVDHPGVDRKHHELRELVSELVRQVKNASKGQIAEYVRAREAWINQ